MMFYEEVSYVVKQTFIEFPHLDEDGSHQMRRNKSEPCLAKDFEDIDDRTTTCGSSVNGDESDILSVSDDLISGQGERDYEDVQLIVKHTFVEFRYVDEEDTPKLRRTQSAPSLLETSKFALLESKNWADMSEFDVQTFVEGSSVKSQSPVVEEDKECSQKSSRRSGRARQREQKRRQLRTPSPEMRNPYCEFPRALPTLCF
jgi:hypothetical protein